MRCALVSFCTVFFVRTLSGQLPSARPATVDATSAESFSTAAEIRGLSDGRVLVNDPTERRLVLLDDRLRLIRVLFDSMTPAPLTYPHGTARLVAAPGDSTWLGEIDARGFRVLDPQGKTVRRQALPDLRDAFAMTGHGAGTALDQHGRLIFGEPARGAPPMLGAPTTNMMARMNIIRIPLDRPGRDTIATVISGGASMSVRLVSSSSARGSVSTTSVAGPTVPVFLTGDDWGVLPSGELAVVRAGDFHLEVLRPDGNWRAAPRVQWRWKVLTPEEKRMLVDSVQRIMLSSDSTRRPPAITLPDGSVQQIVMGPTTVSPDVPDTAPAIAPLVGKIDARGRFWVREGPALPGRPSGPHIYSALDDQGRIVERIRVDDGVTLAGFGSDDTMYLFHLTDKRLQLQRVRARR